MGGASAGHHRHWRHDPGVRLLLIALAIVLAVFVIAFMVMTENVAEGLEATLAGIAAL